MPGSPDSTTVVRRALADALALVLPIVCAGCDAPDVALCEVCESSLVPEVGHRDVAGLRVFSGLVYEGPAARAIRAVKEEGRTGLARALAPALRAAVRSASGERGIRIVPVPTSRASYRRRGFRVAELVARRALLPVDRSLALVRQPGDQRGLDAEERRRNVAGSMRARRPASAPVLLLDDVVTTGATLAEAARALSAEGARVLGAVTIAATPRRSPLLGDSFGRDR
ncbi:MAG: phosphoribosyltransferase family protein [Microbacterium sp.]